MTMTRESDPRRPITLVLAPPLGLVEPTTGVFFLPVSSPATEYP